MISSKIFSRGSQVVFNNTRRSFGILGPIFSKASDPVQKLFLDKIQEYKSKSRDGKMVDKNPAIELEMANELERVAKQFGGGKGVDMTKFPSLTFQDPQIDPISSGA